MALYFECRINKHALLSDCILAILPTGALLTPNTKLTVKLCYTGPTSSVNNSRCNKANRAIVYDLNQHAVLPLNSLLRKKVL